MRGWREWIPVALLAVLVVCAFLPVLSHGFLALYDDQDYVLGNAMVRGGLTLEGVRWALTSGAAGNWHPLTWVSHMLDVSLWGLDPRGHHLTSLLLHVVNTVLLYLVLRPMGGMVRAFFVAALFGIHPLRVESVAWVAERKDVLCVFFWFLGMGAVLPIED